MIKRTTDPDLIKSVLCHDDIWPNIAPKNIDRRRFEPPMGDEYYYLACYDGDELCGLFIYEWADDKALETHHHVLPEFRGPKSILYSILSLAWVFKNTYADRVICCIPDEFPNVIAHAKKGGLSSWYEKEGQQWLKLEREEWDLSEG